MSILNTHAALKLRSYIAGIDWSALVAVALIGFFAVTLLTCFIFPIYPDEIAARFLASRLPYDFPEKITNLPTCVSGFTQPIPITWYLPGLVSWMLDGNLQSLNTFRTVGFMVAFSWVAELFFYLNGRIGSSQQHGNRGPLAPNRQYLNISGWFVSLFSVGVFPIFLILNRDEQLLLPSIIILLFVFLLSDRQESQKSRWSIVGLTVMYFLAVSLAIYGHPKGLFLTPFFLIVGWRLFRLWNSRPIFVASMVLLGLQVAQGYAAWKYSFQCSENPPLNALLKSFSFNPALLIYAPHKFFEHSYASISNFSKYLRQLGFQKHTDANYLPSEPVGPLAKLANIFIWANSAAAFFTALVFVPWYYYRKDIRNGRYLTINATILILLVCVLIEMVFNTPKNWYDAGYIFGSFAVILVFFSGENLSGFFLTPAARKLFLYFAGVSFLSQSVFIYRYLPAFWDGYAGPGISIVNYHYKYTQTELSEASSACGISRNHSHRLIVDDLTYFYYERSQFPMPITYIFLDNTPSGIKRFIDNSRSSGLITRCSGIPIPWIPFAKQIANVCCIPGNRLHQLPKP